MKPRRSTATKERAFVKAALGTRKNAQHPRVAAAPGYGPTHAENALEGEQADPGAIAAVQRKRAMLGFQHGEELVAAPAGREVQRQLELERMAKLLPALRSLGGAVAGGGAESAAVRQLYDKYGLTAPEEQLYPRIPYEEVEPQLAAKGVKAVQGNTDSVPAMLTPREAVLNRNAAEMAGRGKIQKLNEAGNKLAMQGVDLAGGGGKKMKKMQKGGLVPRAFGNEKFGAGNDPRRLGGPAPGGVPGPVGGPLGIGRGVTKPMPVPGPKAEARPAGATGKQMYDWGAKDWRAGGWQSRPAWWDLHLQNLQNPGRGAGGPPVPGGGGGVPGPTGGPLGLGGGPAAGGGMTTLPAPWRDPGPVGGGGFNTLPAPWQGGGGYGGGLSGGYGGWGGGLPSGGGAQGWGGGFGGGPGIYGKASGSFYPQASASATKPYMGFAGGVSDLGGPGIGANYGAPPQLQSGDIGSLVAALTKAAQQQGLNGQQIQGLLSALQGAGGAGGGGVGYGGGTGPSDAAGGFQGGISDIGYPPQVGPGMTYHADKGSSWVGPYDPAYMINRQP